MEGKTSLQVFFLLGLQVKERKYVIFNTFIYFLPHSVQWPQFGTLMISKRFLFTCTKYQEEQHTEILTKNMHFCFPLFFQHSSIKAE